MQLKNLSKLLSDIQKLDVPISNTTRGEAIHQTYRNTLTKRLHDALFKDCQDAFDSDESSGILPFLTREGIILDVPNEYVADNTDPNMCNGSISIVWSFTIKGLEYDGAEAAREYEFDLEQARKKAEETERKKQAKIEHDRKAREEREAKRARLVQQAMLEDDDE